MTDRVIAEIRAALDETERVARAALGDSVFDGTGIVVGPRGTAVLLSTAARHIALHDPERELRMVAAHQKILDEHRNDGGDCSTCHGTPEREVLWDGSEETWSWTSVPIQFPCPTVTALAAALQVEV